MPSGRQNIKEEQEEPLIGSVNLLLLRTETLYGFINYVQANMT